MKHGYKLYECTTEDEIQCFKKYYAKGERLCTFDGGRLDKCIVFFAVKKDVDNIMRDEFEKPEREDEYGTSVMSIQFNKTGICTVSIKNRYNHTVNNPDATYGNNLDKIAHGLTQSFSNLLEKRGLKLNTSNLEEFNLLGYTVANDGKYYKYNMEISHIYYCPNNIIISDGTPERISNPEKKLLVDYFIIDCERKCVYRFDKIIQDSFVEDLQNLDKIEIIKDNNKNNVDRNILLYKKNAKEPIIIEIDKDNQIIGYINKNLSHVGDLFLSFNTNLENLELPNLISVGSIFLGNNKVLSTLNLPNLCTVGNSFLLNNRELIIINMPKLSNVGNNFLYHNYDLISIDLPELVKAGNSFLHRNAALSELNLPKLTYVGNNFLNCNNSIEELKLPSLIECGDDFLNYNNKSLLADFDNLEKVGRGFLEFNENILHLKMPKLKEYGGLFLEFRSYLADKIKAQVKARSNDIATVDKEAQLTTSEVTSSRNIIEKIRKKIDKSKNKVE